MTENVVNESQLKTIDSREWQNNHECQIMDDDRQWWITDNGETCFFQ